MGKKLLVVTAGTVAASVGQALLKQMKAHSNSELTVMARYIDTAYLPNRNSGLRKGEWFHLSIDPGYMQAIYKKREEYPRLNKMLFDGLLPGTSTDGGGSIRYNGAGAVEVKRNDLRSWLSASMTELAQLGDGSKNISIALIVSAVGATGSGSLEHLVDVIVDAARFAGVRSSSQSTIRCDVYILQPSQDATDLGLANTLALYAELAASQLSGGSTRSYQGRKIMIGWGSDTALPSIDQLRDVAATIVRLSTDPTSQFAAEFQERAVDNHVLRELDPLSSLPMHLSLATVVTISLGRLQEQVVLRDVNRLVNSLVFDSSTGGGSTGENVLLGKFADALAGDSAEARYQKLLEYLSEPVHLLDAQRRIDGLVNSKGTPEGEKGAKMLNLWQEATGEVRQGRYRIRDFALSFSANALLELDRIKGERICKGNVSLTELREEYRALQNTLAAVLKVAREDVGNSVNDGIVARQYQTLNGIWPLRLLNRKTKLRRLAGAIRRNLQEHLQETTRASAIEVLDRLEQRSAEIGRNLDIVLGKLRRKREDDQRFSNSATKFSLDSGNSMNIVALSTLEEMNEYAAQVSIFTSENNGPEQLAEFRQWLQGRPELEALFRGNLDQLMGVITSYTQEKVREAMEKHSVLDILHRSGADTLHRRFVEADNKAKALVDYSEDFAPVRREAWHVAAFYRNEEQREELDDAMKEAFVGQCKLLFSNDPAEIAVFYYVDGIPMSAVKDLKGRCLEAFLNRRLQWQKHKSVLDSSNPRDSINGFNQRVGVPIFSGNDAEQRVRATGVIRSLYEVRGEEVGDYDVKDLPEFADKSQNAPTPAPANGRADEPMEETVAFHPHADSLNGNGHNGSSANGKQTVTNTRPLTTDGMAAEPSAPEGNGSHDNI